MPISWICPFCRDLLLWQGLSQFVLSHSRSQDSMSKTSPSKASPLAEWFIKAFTPGWGYVIEVNGVKAFLQIILQQSCFLITWDCPKKNLLTLQFALLGLPNGLPLTLIRHVLHTTLIVEMTLSTSCQKVSNNR